MKPMIISLFVVAVLSAAQGTQTFIGIVTDDMCPMGDHSRMRMGATDAECAKACIAAHAASYVLYDGKHVYKLNDQETPEQFAGQKARVVGTLDATTMTIRVESIAAADEARPRAHGADGRSNRASSIATFGRTSVSSVVSRSSSHVHGH